MQALYRFIIISIFSSLILISCGRKGPDVSGIKVEVEPHLFFKDLFEGGSDNIIAKSNQLRQKYGGYLEAYCQRVIRIGSSNTSDFPERLKAFIDYEANQEVYSECKKDYSNVNDIVKDLEKAFRYYKYYFPEVNLPDLYFHISGFNESIAIDSSWVSVSVENYLGEDCKFYQWLGKPQYLHKRMVRAKIVPDIIKAMALTTFNNDTKNEDVLSSMIQHGKILYFIHQMMPRISEPLLFDMTKDEIKWCEENEANSWASMVERKDLFSTDRMMIQKYTGDSPFTYYFGQDSPGRVAVYLGHQIVEDYMDRNEKVSLKDLMLDEDAHRIFQNAQYRP